MPLQRSVFHHSYRTWACMPAGVWLALILLSGCVAYQQQPRSPLTPALMQELGGRVWRVADVKVSGESVPFGAVAPIYLWFAQAGLLRYHTPVCSGGGWQVYFEGSQRYRLIEGDVAPVDCGELGLSQYGAVQLALDATNHYEFQDDLLVLRGDDVYILLIVDDTSPDRPGIKERLE